MKRRRFVSPWDTSARGDHDFNEGLTRTDATIDMAEPILSLSRLTFIALSFAHVRDDG